MDQPGEKPPEGQAKRLTSIMDALEGLRSSEALSLLAYMAGSVIAPLELDTASERAVTAQFSQSVTKALAIRCAAAAAAADGVAKGQ